MDKATLDTYNQSAKQLASKFKGIGSRKADVEKAFKLLGKTSPKVLEVGCGDGRDAKEITKLTNHYLGIDTSENLIKLAKSNLKNAEFEVTDMLKFTTKESYDIVFAFASLLHMPKDDIKKALFRLGSCLDTGGIFYISLKKASYQKRIQNDEFGTRTFYYYLPEDILGIAPSFLKKVYLDFQTIGTTDWFTVAFKKTI